MQQEIRIQTNSHRVIEIKFSPNHRSVYGHNDIKVGEAHTSNNAIKIYYKVVLIGADRQRYIIVKFDFQKSTLLTSFSNDKSYKIEIYSLHKQAFRSLM